MDRRLLAIAVVLVGLLAVGILSSSRPTETTQPTTTSPQTTPPTTEPTPKPVVLRGDKIPASAVKVTPEADAYAPILHVEGWEEPVPMSLQINTAGVEDSAFVAPDGDTFYFFFTPDINVSSQGQLLDGITGIWYSTRTAEGWSEALRLDLGGDPALDGAECLQGDTFWFASARAGNYRNIDFWVATLTDNVPSGVRNAGARLNYEIGVGELHVSADGKTIYFDSSAASLEGGKGGVDIWVTRLVDGEWSDPENVADVNTEGDESRPFLSLDGTELWITRTYMGTPAVYRSLRTPTGWSSPELILSQFAGEPTLDSEGNIYFTHHFMRDGKFLETDIYVAYRKP